MTKDELIKAARDMPVQPGDAQRFLAIQEKVTRAQVDAADAEWCPPSRPAPKARVKPMPPRAAPCGLVMDGDRLPAHRAQCGACASGVQAASYAGIDKVEQPRPLSTAPCGWTGTAAQSVRHQQVCRWCTKSRAQAINPSSFYGIDRTIAPKMALAYLDPLGLGRTCGHSSILKGCMQCVAALPILPGVVRTFPDRRFCRPWCGGSYADWLRINDLGHLADRSCSHPSRSEYGEPTTAWCSSSCSDLRLPPVGQPLPNSAAPPEPAVTCCREGAASGGRSHSGGCAPNNAALAALIPPPAPSLAEKLAALPHLSGCDCARCKVGRAAACCNIGWHRHCEGRMCPFHTVAVAPPPLMLLSEWDLLPDG